MKTKKFNKFLSLLLALLLVVGMLPATAMAANTSVSTAEALTTALANAADGDTITLTGAITGNFSYTGSAGKTVTIDGGGKTITGAPGTDTPALTLSGGGTVILKNVTLQGGNMSSHSCGLSVSGGTNVYGDADVIGGPASTSSIGLLCSNAGATVVIDSAIGGNVSGDNGISYGLRSISGTVAVTTATGGPVYGSYGSSYGIANAAANVYAGSATGGNVNLSHGKSYGVGNLSGGSGCVSVGTAQGGGYYIDGTSYGVSNNGSGTVNVSQATGGSSQYQGSSYSVYNSGTGTVNAGTTTGDIDTNTAAGATTNTGSATATLTLNKGTGASCVLDSITVAFSGTTTSVGTLPPVSKDGVVGTWYTTDTLSAGTEFTGTTVNGETVLYSSFYTASSSFTATTDSSTANDTATLGLVGTSAASSSDSIATAAISNGHIDITSISAGAATVTVTDSNSHSATIAVTVNGDGSITIGTITKYVSSNDTPTVTFVDTNNDGTLSKEEVDAQLSSFLMTAGSAFTAIFPNVTAIGESAFKDRTGLTGQLSLPYSLTTIGSEAFSGCTGLTTALIISSNVTTISDKAFYGCSGISGSLTLPEGLLSIGTSAFYGCNKLNGGLDIPDSVTAIGGHAFDGCYSFNGSLQLSSGLTSISAFAFSGCRSFTGNLSIPANVTAIGGYAFNGCSGFTGTLTLPSGLETIGGFAFSGCNSLSGTLSIPNSVTSIGDSAFSGGNSTNGFTGAVVIPYGITQIPDAAFNYCSNISSVTLPSTVTYLGSGAFYSCSSLSSVTFWGPSAPSVETNTFSYIASGAVIHVLPSATGFDSSTWNGLTVEKDLVQTIAPAITSDDHATVTSGVGGTFQVTATGTGTITYSLSGANLPACVTIDSASGLMTIADTVTMADNGKQFTVKASSGTLPDTTQTFTLTVQSPAGALASTLTGLGFTAAVSDSTVTVTGTKTATATLELAIPSGVTVLWKASLTGTVSNPLMQLTGAGIFELSDGGEITNTSGKAILCLNQKLVISGGTVSAGGTVLETAYAQYAPALTMTGGTVRSTSANSTGYAMVVGGKTIISGGTVDAGGGKSILLNNAVVVYRSDLLSDIDSGSLSASVSVDPSKTYAMPGEAQGLTATGYSATEGNVTAAWTVLPGQGTGIAVYYTGAGGGSWQISWPGVSVVGSKQSLAYDANGGSGTLTGTTVYYGQSYTVSANAFTKSSYNFTGWNTQADGKGTAYAAGAVLTGADSSDAVILYAQWSTADSGGGNGSGGSSGGSTPAPAAPSASVSGSTATTTVKPTIGTDGKATAAVTAAQIGDALEKAQEASKTGDPLDVKIKVEGTSGVNSVAATIPSDSVKKLASGGISGLTVSSGLGDLTFGKDALKTISGAASGDVKVTASKVESSTLSDDAKKVVGSHPVYEFSVTSGGKTISEFGGTVTASLPYTPAAGEDPKAIVIYYIAADGTLTMVPDAHYDEATGRVVFTTTHFSTYAVGYNKVSFRDVADTAWYSQAVSYLAARGITSGTTTTTFGPNTVLTRGQFITMLLKAYGIAPETNSGDNFSDAGSTYYTGYLASAKKLGVSDGIGGNLFAPNKAVTRQEMFTMLYNALKAIDKQPEGTSGKALSDFSDASNVASWATDAMNELAKTGTISGNGGKLSPTNTTTRAEMAQVLYNLLGK